MLNPKNPMKKPILINKQQQKEDKLKGKLKVACEHGKEWKYQIH